MPTKQKAKPRRPQPGLTSAVAAAVAGPLLGSVVKERIAEAVVDVAKDTSIPGLSMADAGAVTGAVIDALGKDDKLINASNSEPFWQSGIAWGAGVTALGVLVPIGARLFGFDIATEQVVEVGGSVVTIGGIIYTLYRRFMPGLKPLFSGASK